MKMRPARSSGCARHSRSGNGFALADVDAHCAHARQHGARIVKDVSDMPFGVRQYTAEDPEGHRWTFSQNIADVPPERWGAKVAGR